MFAFELDEDALVTFEETRQALGVKGIEAIQTDVVCHRFPKQFFVD